MKDNDKAVLELESAAEWFEKHGKNTNTAIIGICKRASTVIKEQKEENERLRCVIKILEKDVKEARERGTKSFAHFLIDRAKSGGVIHMSDLPDYVCEFLRGNKDDDTCDC